MSLKQAIKKAITEHSPKYRATKVWTIEVSEDGLNSMTMRIEVTVKRKPKPKKPKVN